MAVLPLGSANDFARSCGIPRRNLSKALLLAASTEPTGIDVGRVNQRYFLNSIIAGFGAEATFRATEPMKRWLGSMAYRVTGMVSALRPAVYPVQVRTSEGVERTPVSFFAVMNGRWAGGAQISSRAKLSDGKLDLLSVPACSVRNFPALIADFRAKPHRDPTFVRYEQREWFEIEAPGMLPVTSDGERISGSRLRISILKRRLPFALLPAALG